MKKLAFFLILIILTTSCTQLRYFFNLISTPKPEIKQGITLPKEPDFPLMPMPDFIYPIIERGIVVNCESHIQDIKNILGEPDTVTIEKSPNPHSQSQIDERHELSYKGLNISVYVFEDKDLMDDTTIIVGFTLTGKQYYLPGNIRIGSSLSQVKKQMKPLTPTKNYFLYNNTFEEGYDEAIRFYFSKEKLSKVVWYCAIN